MKTTLGVISTLLLISTSCHDSLDNPKPALTPSILKQANDTRELVYDADNRVTLLVMTSRMGNGGSMVTKQDFEYDGRGLVARSSTNTGWGFVYLYNGDLLTKTEEYVNGQLFQTHKFEYDFFQHVTQSITYQNIPDEGGVIPVSKSTYAYDANGNVLQNKQYYYSTGGTNESLLTTFDYSDFDNKINTEVSFARIPINPYLVTFRNNPGKLEIRNGNGVLTTTEVYSHTYNSQNYATSKTTTSTQYDGTSQSYQTQYTFK